MTALPTPVVPEEIEVALLTHLGCWTQHGRGSMSLEEASKSTVALRTAILAFASSQGGARGEPVAWGLRLTLPISGRVWAAIFEDEASARKHEDKPEAEVIPLYAAPVAGAKQDSAPAASKGEGEKGGNDVG